ncbi:MAG: aspartate carbamoyltransferase [Candidatus Aenigmarchaeota archaeon]|nr:aspartate carbamoyltransferase [Candidatus Aenigmarchaeota archaeon]
MGLMSKDIITTVDLPKEDVEEIMKQSEAMLLFLRDGRVPRLLKGKILATMFFEPSTRTRLSFTSAMLRLGGSVLGFSGTEGTSIKKGESLEDTVRMVDSYSDIIVMRHPDMGSSALAARIAKNPVISGGDGHNHHPTQGLMDLFTIMKEKGLRGVNVALCGDLKYGRTTHSLIYLLAMYGLGINLVSPASLRMPAEIVKEIKRSNGCEIREFRSMSEVVSDVDVLYVTRIQKERFLNISEYGKLEGSYRVDRKLLGKAKKGLIVMHPLPRVSEISTEVDGTPFAKYFDHAAYGVPVRMALLSLLLGKV